LGGPGFAAGLAPALGFRDGAFMSMTCTPAEVVFVAEPALCANAGESAATAIEHAANALNSLCI
jgi:hypothetical protein